MDFNKHRTKIGIIVVMLLLVSLATSFGRSATTETAKSSTTESSSENENETDHENETEVVFGPLPQGGPVSRRPLRRRPCRSAGAAR